MAAGTRQSNTMQEQLRKLLGSFADLKLSEDADFDYIGKLETAVLAKLREPIDRVAQQGLTAVQPGISQGMVPVMGGGPVPPMAAPVPPALGQGGITPSPNMAPVADELRQILMNRGQ